MKINKTICYSCLTVLLLVPDVNANISVGKTSRSAVVTRSANNENKNNVSRTGSDTSVVKKNTVERVSRNIVSNQNRANNARVTRSTKGVLSRTGEHLMQVENSISGKIIALANQKNRFSRSALKTPLSALRSSITKNANVSRSATSSRATAVFSDMSKIGSGYSACRESYATCMDQFCANANDTYRRCYCSSRFQEFRDKENAIDQAKTLLTQFEDNNLNAIGKTSDEVSAMYTASNGEKFVEKDTSSAANTLNEIADILSGKKKANNFSTSNKSIASLSMDFSIGFDDIWSGNSSSIFDSLSSGRGSSDLTSLEGEDLYRNAQKQCLEVIKDSCQNDAVLNMSKSSYSIMITQDCNLYEKKINSSVEQVKETLRTAEKYLRDARLEEYRSHNTPDVNACLDKVERAMTESTACGTDYVKCLDYSGVYINSTTGDPIYSPRLFELNTQITLNGSYDVLTQNPNFNKFLDEKKIYANTALDGCRNIADTVWQEFKRSALIKISQAQDEKIEEVKNSCVETMKECYDTQSGALKSFDNTTAQASGALSAAAARGMCSDKVIACAALYGDTDGCVVDNKTNKVTEKSGKQCGLKSLMSFVDTVDSVKIAEGCDTALDNYIKDLCTPTSGDKGYPWACRLRKLGNETIDISDMDTVTDSTSLSGMIKQRANMYCNVSTDDKINMNMTADTIKKKIADLKIDLENQLADFCENMDGVWFSGEDPTSSSISSGEKLGNFYSSVYATSFSDAQTKYNADDYGICIVNTIKTQCDLIEQQTGNQGYATYNVNTQNCDFTVGYYEFQCNQVNGMWDGTNCYF